MSCDDPACITKVTEFQVAQANAQVESTIAIDLCHHAKSLSALALAAAAVAAAAIAAAKVAAAAGSAALLTGVGWFVALAFVAGALALAVAAGVAIGVSGAAAIAAFDAARDYKAASIACTTANNAAKTAWDAHITVCEGQCAGYTRFPCSC